MGQIVGCVTGMGDACRALDYPIVSGNVSLYNETEGTAILPTPVIGGVGVIEDVSKLATPALKAAGESLVALGQPADRKDGWLGASLYLREVEGREEGAPPPLDLAAEKRTGDFVRGLIAEGAVSACHDVSDGGLLVAVAEMALASKKFGADMTAPEGAVAHAWAFGEDQGRYVVTTSDPAGLMARAESAGVPAAALGTVADGGQLTLNGMPLISREELSRRHEAWLPTYMAAED